MPVQRQKKRRAIRLYDYESDGDVVGAEYELEGTGGSQHRGLKDQSLSLGLRDHSPGRETELLDHLRSKGYALSLEHLHVLLEWTDSIRLVGLRKPRPEDLARVCEGVRAKVELEERSLTWRAIQVESSKLGRAQAKLLAHRKNRWESDLVTLEFEESERAPEQNEKFAFDHNRDWAIERFLAAMRVFPADVFPVDPKQRAKAEKSYTDLVKHGDTNNQLPKWKPGRTTDEGEPDV